MMQNVAGCLTHIPGAYEEGNHVGLVLVGMFVLHQLQQLTKCLPLLKQTKKPVKRKTIKKVCLTQHSLHVDLKITGNFKTLTSKIVPHLRHISHILLF